MNSKSHTEKLAMKLASSFRVPSTLTDDGVLMFLESLDCPRSLSVALMYKYNEHKQLAELGCNPLEYSDQECFRDAYAATKFLSKSEFLDTGEDLELVALTKFFEFEELCRLTNKRFRAPALDPLYQGANVARHHAVRRKIARILGEFNHREASELSSWGPGSTTLLVAEKVSYQHKFQLETGITRDLYDSLPAWYWPSFWPGWGCDMLSRSSFPTFCVGDEIVTVDKDATTKRVIAKQPGLNLWRQLGIGRSMVKCLKRFGLDITRSDRNRLIAFLSSISGECASVDFSSASDSIACVPVQDLLPLDWCEAMDACRSKVGVTSKGTEDEKCLWWEKFSTMGNGFTFPLESLIFYACASVVMEEHNIVERYDNIAVFGDDVLLPVTCLESFVELATFYGFKVNSKKTHSTGYFRESCGGHFYNGRDVKPYRLRKPFEGAQDLYRFANGVRRFAHRGLYDYGCDMRFRTLFDTMVSKVPKPIRFRIPETLGDVGFVSNFDEACPDRAKRGWEGFVVPTLSDTSVKLDANSGGFLQWKLSKVIRPSMDTLLGREYSAPFNSPKDELRRMRLKIPLLKQLDPIHGKYDNTYTLRGRVKPAIRRTHVHQWYDLGPWN